MSGYAPLPPMSLDAEESVLGAALISPRAIDACAEILQPGDFWRESHEKIWNAICALHGEGNAVDSITVADRLDVLGQLEEIGGKERVHELAALVPATSNARHYARIIRDMATLRGLTVVGEQIQRLGWDRPDEIPALVDEAERLVFTLAGRRSRSDLRAVGDDMAETFARLQELAARGKQVVGVPSGLMDLDRLTLGFHPGNLIIVGARPSLGKSAMSLGFAAHVALREQLPVAFFTLEMTRHEVQQRLLSMEGNVDLPKLRNGSLDKEDWASVGRVSQALKDAPLYIEDDAAITMLELRGKARRLAQRHPDLALIVVDYLQLLTSGVKIESRTQEVSFLSRSLKLLAGELKVPVVALSQLNRQVENRHDKRPLMSDLRESGGVESDADVILLLFRDDYYAPDDAELDGTAGMCEVNIAKHRNGPTEMVKVAFAKRYARFGNLARIP